MSNDILHLVLEDQPVSGGNGFIIIIIIAIGYDIHFIVVIANFQAALSINHTINRFKPGLVL